MAVLVRRLREIVGKLDGRAVAVLPDDGSKGSGYRLIHRARAMDPRFKAIFRRPVAPGQCRQPLPRQ